MMNKFAVFCLIGMCVTPGLGATRIQLQNELSRLDSEIAQLEAEHEKKTSLLQTCQKSNQNLKTAGIATLAGTGLGVAGNVALHKKYTEGSGIGGGGTFKDYQTQGQVDAYACGRFETIRMNPERCAAAKKAGCTISACN